MPDHVKLTGMDNQSVDMNDVTIPHALSIEKKIVYYIIREGWYRFRKLQCGDPEHQITLCEFNSIKTEDNIDGYIINASIIMEVYVHVYQLFVVLSNRRAFKLKLKFC